MVWLKRLAAPKWWPIERKTKKFVISPRGPHPKELSLPLLILIRDVFRFGETAREARQIIKQGKILVDGRPMKDPNYGIGILDVIEIPELKKAWRVVPKNTFSLVEVHDPRLKICKIIDKSILKKGKTQLNLDCGKNIITENSYSTKDSLLLELPSQKIIESIKLEHGSIALVMKGKNAGLVAKIKIIEKDKNRVWLEEDKKKIEVPIDYITVVGRETPLIKLE